MLKYCITACESKWSSLLRMHRMRKKYKCLLMSGVRLCQSSAQRSKTSQMVFKAILCNATNSLLKVQQYYVNFSTFKYDNKMSKDMGTCSFLHSSMENKNLNWKNWSEPKIYIHVQWHHVLLLPVERVQLVHTVYISGQLPYLTFILESREGI